MIAYMGGGLYLGAQPRPTARGVTPALQILCSFYFCAHPLMQIELPNLTWRGRVFSGQHAPIMASVVTHDKGLVLGVSNAPSQGGGAAPQFLGFLSLCKKKCNKYLNLGDLFIIGSTTCVVLSTAIRSDVPETNVVNIRPQTQ